ncbi:MAG TPA: patatin-like phospholipase family protein [Thermoanaerobaculia bacterium]|nr:patatin-like phospholipase family protein [Thermoanaerobaculia bacterium]
MSSLPLEVYHVLEEEFVAANGPLDREPDHYDEHCVLNEAEARSILRICGIEVRESLCATLNALVDGTHLERLKESPALSERGRELIDHFDDYFEKPQEVWTRTELRRSIVDDALSGAVKSLRDKRLDALYTRIHAMPDDSPRSALCVSGGGIRSATFALGVIQGLASARILRKFDYLSTVSGGGYIGSWLSSWVRRHPEGVTGVENDLHRADTAVGEVVPAQSDQPSRRALDADRAKIDPEPVPIRHLRNYSNYLSPRLGLLSADSWTLGSLYVRNLLLNWLVLVPLLAVALATPRLFSWGIERRHIFQAESHAWIVAIAVTIAFGYIGAARPLEGGRSAKLRWLSSRRGYFLGVIVPLVIASISLALFWADAAHLREELVHAKTPWPQLITAVLGMALVPWLTYYGRAWLMHANARSTGFLSTRGQRRYFTSKTFIELFAVVVAMATSAGLFLLLAKKVFSNPIAQTPNVELLDPYARLTATVTPDAALYVCFAVPSALLVFFIQASIFVGLSSRRNDDGDREWWARGGALLLMFSIGIAVFNVIAVFGPVALYYAPILLSSIGGVAGIAAATLGFSDKTPANQKEKEESGTFAKVGNLISAAIIPLFIVFILAAISLGTTWLIHEIKGPKLNEALFAEASAKTWQRTEVARQVANGTVIETRQTVPARPLLRLEPLRAAAHLVTIRNTSSPELLAIAAVGLVALLLSLAIGVNKFSMHALYRNRLIRAYLGASRNRRIPDPFTGFDERDNLQMFELRPELLWKSNVTPAFVEALKNDKKLDLWGKLDERTLALFESSEDVDAAYEALASNLNHLIMTDDFAQSGLPLPDCVTLHAQDRIGHSRPYRNRALLDEYVGVIPKMPTSCEERGPMHIVNTALNLTSGQSLAWQQRMAESFTISPYHSGSLYEGYRDSHTYGGPRGISLGTAVTISGAAASPNMGYHSSPAMAFLLTIFNVRLGSWLGNTNLFGNKAYTSAHPTSNLVPLTSELTGGSNNTSKWIYLSDGGHFENLAMYEMVLRRCRYIVVSDAGADPKYSFEDLGNAIRKIRTDLGVPIDIIETFEMEPRGDKGKFGKGRYVARAAIRYSTVDVNGKDGTLIYIKAGIYGSAQLPRDVYNYSQESLDFPHESTADQFFSESQFESYRALGRHAINEICANYSSQRLPIKSDTRRVPIAKQFENVRQFDDEVRTHL